MCVIFCGKSLKKELWIDTTFDPCYFSWDSPFKENTLKELCTCLKTLLLAQTICIICWKYFRRPRPWACCAWWPASSTSWTFSTCSSSAPGSSARSTSTVFLVQPFYTLYSSSSAPGCLARSTSTVFLVQPVFSLYSKVKVLVSTVNMLWRV